MQVADRNRSHRTIVVLAVVCAVLELALAPNVALGLGRINFALVFAGCMAFSFGGRTGVISGFAAGLFFDLCTTGPIGLMALLCTVSAYLLGAEVRNKIATEPGHTVVEFAIATVIVSLLYHLMMLVMGDGSSIFDALFLRTVPTALLTVIAYLPFMLVLSRRDGGGSSLGGAHSAKRLR